MFVDGEVGGKEQQSASMVLTEWGHYAFCQDICLDRVGPLCFLSRYDFSQEVQPAKTPTSPPRCEVEALHDD